MKALKVCHQLGIGRIGEQKRQPERLHEISMTEKDDAATGARAHQSTYRFARSVEKLRKRLGARSIDERMVSPLPVGQDMRVALLFAGAPVARRIEKGELLDGPLLDRNIGEALSQRLGGLLCAQEWRDDEERWIAGEPLGEVPGLQVSKVSQGIADVVCGLASGVGQALAMPNQNDPRDCRRCGFGQGLPSGEGVASLLIRSSGMFAVSTARSLCCSTFADSSSSRTSVSGAAVGCISACVCCTDLTSPSSELSVSVAWTASASVGAICSMRRWIVPR